MGSGRVRQARRYLRFFVGTLGFSLIALASFAFVVDPWGIWHSVTIDGLNRHKISTWKNQWLHKTSVIACSRPDALLLGSSRALALSPAHPGLRALAQRPYNAGINGAGVEDLHRAFRFAQGLEAQRIAVIGIDFFMFGTDGQAGPRERERLRWFSEHPGCWPDPADRFPTLLSRDAVRASLRTVRRQRALHRESYMRPDGTWGAGELLHDISRGRQRRIFRSTEASMLPFYRNLADGERVEAGLRVLQSLLEETRDARVQAHVFISPFHARIGELMDRAGRWEAFEAWKRRVVEVAEAAGAPPVWDFSGYNSVTTEPVPTEGDAAQAMRWYWDSSHYAPSVGDLILDRVLDADTGARVAGFGVRLTGENIEDHLERIRSERARYRRERAEDLTDIAGE
ncbi:MAG: hypothetical protein HKP27_13090 [Myxococcales bacterium]|nr:hypothetical protein [Myxococcales bacterium]